jgi:uncharacterized protein YfaS (alpha-2-macroglobulin family)
MKKLLASFLLVTLFTLFTMNADSQSTNNYEKEWKKVESFEKQNLPKSAIAEVRNIYALAKKANQDAQVLKALVYLANLQESIRENSDILSIGEIEKEIPGSKEPATSLLNSLLGSFYWKYYQAHRWDFYNRTQTVNFKKDDIATWTAEDFHKKVSELYLKSVSNKKLLQQTKLQPYDAIITKGNVRHIRPTLFDLLAHHALPYFENDERDVNKPAYTFEIGQAAAFDPAADFVRFKFVTKDSLSLQHKALLLYQDLIAFHLNDPKPDALVDVDIDRIAFVNRQSVHPDKDRLYFNAVNHIAHQYGNLPAASQAWFLLANYYMQRAAGYKPFQDTTHRYDLVKAKEICERVIAQKDSSQGKVNCMNLLKNITMPFLHFQVEKVNLPNQPFRVLINYKNLSAVNLRIIKASDFPNLENIRQSSDENYWTSLFQTKSVRSWTQALPATGDYQQHAVEIKIDALPSDEYILLASSDKNFNYKKGVAGMNVFYVSPISYVNDQQDVFVLNRETGQPLANAAVQVWEQTYDYTSSKYIRQKAKLYKADANGYIHTDKKIDEKNRYNYSYLFEITHNNERLFMRDLMNDYYPYHSPDLNKSVNSIFLFTDRSLYRPGQTVYFKGIVMSRNSILRKANILTAFTTTIYLRDANGQNIDSLKLTSNEFGSVSGKFQLPQTGLNGQFMINAKDAGMATFNVEEYKRPKFYVAYDPLKGAYKVGDKIKITGAAKAYAGNNIDGATVRYRVIRQPRFLYPWLFKRWWQPPSEPLEIIHGEAKTDKDGKFIVEFTAIPDLKIDKKFDPVFDYVIYADITDINGETRSGEQTVSAGYKSLLIKSTIPSSQLIDSIRTWPIRTENMNGQFEPASLTVKIIRLKEEKRLIRPRYWERPDQYLMTKDEYIKLFPNDEYADESDPETWEKGETVFEKTDSSRSNGQWPIRELAGGQAVRFLPGYYAIEITTKDKNGEEVKDVRYIEMYDNTSTLTRPQYLWTNTVPAIEPGETKPMSLATSADNLFVIQQVTKGTFTQPQSSFSFIRLNKEKKTISFTATEEDRGGYAVDWIVVKNNRVYQGETMVMVPWSNKELTIEYATYRDKTLPGSEEKWKLKISGYKNEKVAAEMLASMYDASLDQFYLHRWELPNLWINNYYSDRLVIAHNFAAKSSSDKYIPYESKELVKEYDQFIWLSYYHPIIARSMRNAAPAKEEAMAAGRVPMAFEPVGDMRLQSNKRNYERGNVVDFMDAKADGVAVQPNIPEPAPLPGEVQVRKNFNETAFFFPDLKTDSEGNIEFSFTLPEALTRWKFQALAHTKDLAFGLSTKEIVTQKQLMVQPNAPRFIREGDKMEFSSKIVNLTEKEMTGQATLQLIDATTNQPLDSWFRNTAPVQYFTVAPGQSEAVKFSIEIPYQFNKALVWRIVARSGNFSDGEENAMPVLTNRMLVTETLPLNVRGNGTRNFTFDKLLQSGKSETLQHYGLTVEYTSNPAWYAVQALPYLMEYPYECAEQNWNRYYANSLGAYIANSAPRIRQVFEQWKIRDTAALLSNLQKNQELKAILLEETPWVLQAKTEAEQKKNLALLFDMVRMSAELNGTYEKLKQMQSSNGGFVWFKGGPDDRFITQYIVTGIGHLKKLNGIAKGQEEKLRQILSTAIPYLDKKLKEDYDNLIKSKSDTKKYVPAYNEVYYLYMRSFFPEYKIPAATQTAYNYFRQRAQQSWTTQNKYMQGMLALALHRTGDTKTPAAILRSLQETSITNEELGMYWKDARRGWWWYEAPVERQALLIEAFQEINKDTKTVDDLKTWLLKNKQTNSWESTKATAEACYALLLQGTGAAGLSNTPAVEINLGPTSVKTTGDEEAGTGYFKKTISGSQVNAGMGSIKVNIQSAAGQSATSWGAVYWQYFENLDKITTAATPLSLSKKLFVEKNTDRGPSLTPVNDGDYLKVGNKIKVRIELRVDRDMEYVHMKDMRASCMEPVNVLSSYKWQGGLGYYETTKDASTSFFFNSLRKGTYVFEYTLFVTHTGNFSNGVTTIQCMYAPEFSSHSEGIRVNVE